MQIKNSVSIAALVLSVGLTACGGAPSDDGQAQVASNLASSDQEVASLKMQIRALANANTTRTDNFTDVRAQIDPLVARLSAIYGRPTVAQELPTLAGAWRQLWSDDYRDNPGPVELDLARTYQVVTAEGYFYNFADQRLFSFLRFGGALRGKYMSTGTGLDIEFTRFGFLPYTLPKDVPLVDLARQVEVGNRRLIDLSSLGGGNGPVGVRGKIENLYLDADFRVARGGTAEQNYDRLYVLDRVQTP